MYFVCVREALHETNKNGLLEAPIISDKSIKIHTHTHEKNIKFTIHIYLYSFVRLDLKFFFYFSFIIIKLYETYMNINKK